MTKSCYRVALILACALVIAPVRAQRDAGSTVPPLRIDKQGSFFVGGRDIHSDTLSSTATRAPSGTITVDQVYVHYQVPVGAQGHPVTFIHGCCLTGKTWETTPDGRMGWDEYFVRKGHGVYVIDQASRGRSAANRLGHQSNEARESPGRSTAAGVRGLARGGVDDLPFRSRISEDVRGTAVPSRRAGASSGSRWFPTGSRRCRCPIQRCPPCRSSRRRLQGTILISHSQSGIYPFQTAALNTSGISAIVAIEPAACPAATDSIVPYTKMPILVLFGDYVDLSRRGGRRGSRRAATSHSERTQQVERPKWCCCPTSASTAIPTC